MLRLFYYLVFIFFLISSANATAAQRVVNLIVTYKTVHFAGKSRQAIAVNNQIPAPTLHFKEGDHVTIHVHNKLAEETALHWHGIILPWQMDGVAGITQRGIPPGETFHYQFTLRQAGTYWYHAHAGLQEQQGLYGAFIIDPIKHPAYQYNKDYVVVLSDWSNTYPEQILANLKKEGDYYSPNFPLQPSLAKFIHDYRKASIAERIKLVSDYKMMQQMRMSIYDFSDVAYDAFLMNGRSNQSPWLAPVKIGDTVRLRFIGAGGSTIFRVKIPGATMQMVHVDGNDIKPHPVHEFTIAPGETYDVLITIKKKDAYIIYAESSDTVGAAYGALISSPKQLIYYHQIKHFPEPPPVTGMMMHHESSSMHMKTEEDTQYQRLTAAVQTNDPNKPITSVFNMALSGYMDRYIWFINGVPEYAAKPIVLSPGKRYRFIFSNNSMMHHPMHIHGHWFILRKGAGAYDPLLHTIDVPPGATITADLDTDASGQWLFHCHLLYHMMSGMSRVFQYASLIEITQDHAKPQHIIEQTPYYNRPIVRVDEVRPIDVNLVTHPMAHTHQRWLATFLDIGADPFHNAQRLTYKSLYGSDYHKLELFINDAEISKGKVEDADIDIFYWYLIDQFWTIKGGANYTYRPANTPYWQPGIGIEGLMPYFIDTDIRAYYHSGSAKLDIELSRDTQITNNFFVRIGARSILASKTVSQAEIGSGLNQMRYAFRPYYRLMPGLSAFIEYEHEQDYGKFKTFQSNAGEETMQNTVTFGLSMLF